MTSYILLIFFHLISITLSTGEYLEESNTVYKYGLPELTRDILERIKLATGQPINTKHFYPILASSSKGYEIIEQQPLTEYSKYLRAKHKEALEGTHYHASKGDETDKHKKDRHYELGEKQKEGTELVKHNYGHHSRKHHSLSKNRHKSNGGKKEGKSKKGRKYGKFHVEKGFRDIYHKDEEKKSDYFWNNQHEEGKWIEYGFRNKKSEKNQDKGEEEKKEKDKTEESKYEKKEGKCLKCKTR